MSRFVDKLWSIWPGRSVTIGLGAILLVFAVLLPGRTNGSGALVSTSVSASTQPDLTPTPNASAGSDGTTAPIQHFDGAGLDKEAKDLFDSVSASGNDEAIPLDYSESFHRLNEAAKNGNATALYLLSHAFESGMGAASDNELTSRWHEKVVFRKAGAGQYDSVALTPQSYSEAFESFRHAAEMGDVSAELYMGLAYCFGQDVPVNFEQGVRWFQRAAAQGSTSAENNLGVLFQNGQGIPKDNALAVQWLDKAARGGNSVAQHNLGRVYLAGNGVPRDTKLSLMWLVRSGEQGNEQAQAMLSSMYATGNGVSGSLPTAYMWLNLASATNEGARAARDKIEKLLPPEEVAEGQRMTREWIAKNPQEGG